MTKQKVFIDIETSDPDDILTLIYFLGVDTLEIIGITINPGTQKQIDLVKFILGKFGKNDIQVGSFDYNNRKFVLSPWYTKAFGNIPESQISNIDGPDLILKLCDENTILFTGGPNQNLGKALVKDKTNKKFKLKAWFAQGGFAGVGVVPDEYIMNKFKGKVTCATFNFGGSIKETKMALNSDSIPIRYLCSKNVCHNVIYDNTSHIRVKKYLNESKQQYSNKYKSIKLIYDAMERAYKMSSGKYSKKIHDILPAVCISNLDVCEWKEVSLYCAKSSKGWPEWGSNLEENTNTFISVNYNNEQFWSIILN